MKIVVAFIAAASLVAIPAVSNAAPCRDAKGKFIKCAEKKEAPKRCKDAKGKFAKCGTAGGKASLTDGAVS